MRMKLLFPKKLDDFLLRNKDNPLGFFVSIVIAGVVIVTVIVLSSILLIPVGIGINIIWDGVVGLVVWLFFLFKDYPTLLIPVVIAGIALISIGTKIDQ